MHTSGVSTPSLPGPVPRLLYTRPTRACASAALHPGLPGPVPRLLYTRGCAPDPLEVVGPENPPGARVTQNSRHATDAY